MMNAEPAAVAVHSCEARKEETDWFQAAGDVEDFIFFDEDYRASER